MSYKGGSPLKSLKIHVSVKQGYLWNDQSKNVEIVKANTPTTEVKHSAKEGEMKQGKTTRENGDGSQVIRWREKYGDNSNVKKSYK